MAFWTASYTHEKQWIDYYHPMRLAPTFKWVNVGALKPYRSALQRTFNK